jgi:acetyl esterase/lipase
MNRRAFGSVLTAAFCLAGCSPLTAFNTFAPVDPGATLARADIPYGAEPRQRLDLYVPARREAAAPVVVFFYGGGWNSGAKGDYAFVGKAFASQGFVTVIADYRLVPAIRFPAFIEDGAQAIRWTNDHIAEFGGDPHRLYLLGHSAGAYNAVMLTLDQHYLRQAGLPSGIVRATAALAGPYDFLPLSVDEAIAAFSQSKNLAQTQPINFVSRSAPPMFLATGDADATVYPRNTINLAEQSRAAGADVEEKIYPGASHVGIMLALSRPFRGRAPVLADVVRFFRTH